MKESFLPDMYFPCLGTNVTDLLNLIRHLIYTPLCLPECTSSVIKPTHPHAHTHSHIEAEKRLPSICMCFMLS